MPRTDPARMPSSAPLPRSSCSTPRPSCTMTSSTTPTCAAAGPPRTGVSPLCIGMPDGTESSADFGGATAILLGDLLLAWSDELFGDALEQLDDRRAGHARPAGVRSHARRRDSRAVPGPARGSILADAPSSRAAPARPPRHPLQVGQVHRRGTARDRRKHRGRLPRPDSTRSANSGGRSGSRSSCGTTYSASTVTRR